MSITTHSRWLASSIARSSANVQQNEGAPFRTRLPDRCATAGGTVATATSASLGPTINFSTANVTNAKLIALLENEN